MKTTEFDYFLPPELIAQTPVEPARCLAPAGAGSPHGRHHPPHVPRYPGLPAPRRPAGGQRQPGDPGAAARGEADRRARWRSSCCGRTSPPVPPLLPGKTAVLVFRRGGAGGVRWECLVGGKGLRPGVQVTVRHGDGGRGDITATILAETESGGRVVAFDPPAEEWLWDVGEVPLPPYIHEPLADPERYQTVYSRSRGRRRRPPRGCTSRRSCCWRCASGGLTWRSSPCISGWTPSGPCRPRRSSSTGFTGSGPS